ncbi:deoxyguanosinetriphosphate triphosphohydrolase [Accumulibacter sp.]|uniref:deoxyguanosinetriphosphate triphosphohydrolase n=1 Tax=Accumulibacter sp. TaxID=2053492 RepID=UPI0025EB8FAA|nr:deoxyguanosinetriphosphate triphosphohydrolase [Accumulibacter sp.]MCM8593797.1 deoxyguanosinetriphosphate triphosphohydrolase [Accumulibacter sp.]MCM8626161.1 deoxyguanosinetriphosphate triphosphohydrolase [Accumulibacter sp.]MDS4047938.1 deoxyguanosinetriphosphate triphosphohydrolase [Accumulibacter sp.]
MAELARYAVSADGSRGRRHAEAGPAHRDEFQRDRDRIVHSTAFRRLEYKTQVFVNHEGDLFRTRLTHSLEVAQIARGIARALRVNEDLTEAIALAHDLGHTPFGHAGQDALDACMREHGGFEHNLQSLRTVDVLEQRYAAFDGLNLCFETREGILKHCSRTRAQELGDVGRRFVEGQRPSLEAQICNLADSIAYNNHDVDDGLRAGLLSIEQLEGIELFTRHVGEVRSAYPGLAGRRLIHETIRRMINALVCDVIETSAANITREQPDGLDAVRLAPPLVAFSSVLGREQAHLKRFLHEALYRHHQVLRTANKARRIITDLFAAFTSDPRLLPPQYQGGAPDSQERRVADYIAGMTDRYAIREHQKLFAVDLS